MVSDVRSFSFGEDGILNFRFNSILVPFFERSNAITK